MMLLILTVCALAQPDRCSEQQLSFLDEGGSLMQCAMHAPPTIAQWSESHPGLRVARWRCAYPGMVEQKT